MPSEPRYRLLKSKELCRELRIHQSTLYRLMRTPGFPVISIGADYRFELEAVLDFVRRGRARKIIP